MIPVKLSVRNFMCYRDTAVHVDLERVHMACLSGENGAGKSALLDSITWALWGKARDGKRSDDELICLGATEMEVEFHFILADCRYRVVRKRNRKGTGSTVLELHMQEHGEGAWRPLTGHTVRDTQARITGLLKMEYHTFINSAFILQGRADEFTVKTASERKQVLADILGLEDYDRLEEAAKEEAKQRKAAMLGLDMRKDSIEDELRYRPEYTQQLEQVKRDLADKQQEQTGVKEALGILVARQQDLQNNLTRLRELQEKVAARKQELDSLQTRIYRNNGRKAELNLLLSEREDIEKGYSELLAAQGAERRYIEAKDRLGSLETQRVTLVGFIEREHTRLLGDARVFENKIGELSRNLAGRSVAERQLSETLDNLQRLQKLQEQHEDARCLRESSDSKMKMLTAEMNTLKEEGTGLREKLNMLMGTHSDGKGHAECPLCGTGLTADALARVQRSYEQDIDERTQEWRRKKAEQDEANRQIIESTTRMQKLADALRDLAMYRSNEAKYSAKLSQLDEDQVRLEKEQGSLKALMLKIDQGDYAHEERKELASVQGQIAVISYDPVAHNAVTRRIVELEEKEYNKRYHALEGADRELSGILATLEADNGSVASLRKEIDHNDTEIGDLQPQMEVLKEVEQIVAMKRYEEHTIDVEVQRLMEQQGALNSKLEHCDGLEVEKQTLMERYTASKEEKRIYDELSTAFGKKGIQAMIIQDIVPELEDKANELLQRMTDGRMSVQFPMQRDAKTVKNGVIETLDIDISDEMGTRAYELYSGGEAFRVNLALRVALSKLLASRAGAQLQMLVVDEGFGTQDGQGRDKLVSAIRSIENDFEKILVVTHIEELKNEFPMRIDVIKTENGSTVVMN